MIESPKQVTFRVVDICDKKYEDRNYELHLFGRTLDNQSIHVLIDDYVPYFFVKFPASSKSKNAKKFVKLVDSGSRPELQSITSAEIVDKLDFNHFNNYESEPFVKISVRNMKRMGEIKNFISQWCQDAGLYESRLDPILRFFHDRDCLPAGNVTVVDFDTCQRCYASSCDLDVVAKSAQIKHSENQDIPDLVISSFDIECISGNSESFPDPTNNEDRIIQIGTTTHTFGKVHSIQRHIVTLNSCDNLPGVEVQSFTDRDSNKAEKNLLQAWFDYIRRVDSDFITGYNIFGFDMTFIFHKAQKYRIPVNLSRFKKHNEGREIVKPMHTGAILKYFGTPGRVQVDLMKAIEEGHKFPSYSLDNVAGEFLNGNVTNVAANEAKTKIKLTITNSKHVDVGNFISFSRGTFSDSPGKWPIQKLKAGVATLAYDSKMMDYLTDTLTKESIKWKLKKDDMSVADLFQFQREDSAKRALIAKYCIQDNILCNKLIERLSTIPNKIAMANVCLVPIWFLFSRGSGVRAFSLVAKQCMGDNYVIRDVEPPPPVDKDATGKKEVKYQGAVVLEAHPGGYMSPVACNDFASLYPSSIISGNLSPDTWIQESRSVDIPTETFKITDSLSHTFVAPDMDAQVTDEYYRPRRGIIPRVLLKLLAKRAETRKKMKTEKDPFTLTILDGQQVSYKLMANSMYGQMGSVVSPISCVSVAASTTAIGRSLLMMSCDQVKTLFPDAKIVYGDTDSVMVQYSTVPENATDAERISHLEYGIECAKTIEAHVSKLLPFPHCLEYEKTYYPFILYSKKKYSGVMYGHDATKPMKIDNKGIVLARRDNARIVKYMFNGALEQILTYHSVQGARDFIKTTLMKFINWEFPDDYISLNKAWKRTASVMANEEIDKLTIQLTQAEEQHDLKTIRLIQAKIEQLGRRKSEQPHVTVVKKRAARGNYTTRPNDRIPYIIVRSTDASMITKVEPTAVYNDRIHYELVTRPKGISEKDLIGERAEDIDYARKHKLLVDCQYYIDNQISNPLCQLMGIFEDREFLKEKDLSEKDIEKLVQKHVYNELFGHVSSIQDVMARGGIPLEFVRYA